MEGWLTLIGSLMITVFDHFKIIEIDFLIFGTAAFAETLTASSRYFKRKSSRIYYCVSFQFLDMDALNIGKKPNFVTVNINDIINAPSDSPWFK
uniref:Uncharacterized protein n=1 Tax=Romanomermis culicivorax TaxID=13658 RepID=A0A915JXW3_ROMCU